MPAVLSVFLASNVHCCIYPTVQDTSAQFLFDGSFFVSIAPKPKEIGKHREIISSFFTSDSSVDKYSVHVTAARFGRGKIISNNGSFLGQARVDIAAPRAQDAVAGCMHDTSATGGQVAHDEATSFAESALKGKKTKTKGNVVRIKALNFDDNVEVVGEHPQDGVEIIKLEQHLKGGGSYFPVVFSVFKKATSWVGGPGLQTFFHMSKDVAGASIGCAGAVFSAADAASEHLELANLEAALKDLPEEEKSAHQICVMHQGQSNHRVNLFTTGVSGATCAINAFSGGHAMPITMPINIAISIGALITKAVNANMCEHLNNVGMIQETDLADLATTAHEIESDAAGTYENVQKGNDLIDWFTPGGRKPTWIEMKDTVDGAVDTLGDKMKATTDWLSGIAPPPDAPAAEHFNFLYIISRLPVDWQ